MLMLLRRRYRSIVCCMMLQAAVFVWYSCRFHFYATQRNFNDWIPSAELLEQSAGNNTRNDSNTSNNTDAHISPTTVTVIRPVDSDGTTRGISNVSHSWFVTVGQDSTDDDEKNSSISSNIIDNRKNNTTDNFLFSEHDLNTTRAGYTKDTLHDTYLMSNITDIGYSSTASYTITKTNASTKPTIKPKTGLYPSDVQLTFPFANEISEDCVKSFLQKYSEYCEIALTPSLPENGTGSNTTVCSCIPDKLLGTFQVSIAEVPLSQTETEHPELVSGGHWYPKSCIARQRVAIIIPFRNRESQLGILLRNLHPFLQRQLLDYTVFVVEQTNEHIFNKASLMNAGFKEIKSRFQFDCFVFHDVDMLPEDDRNFYGCYMWPRHVGAYVDKFKYNLPYVNIFGGATAFTEKQFSKVNGYSNEFFGWGGEDDDMYNRIKWCHLKYLRFPKCVARYKMIKHSRDKTNPYNALRANRAWSMRPSVYKNNGLHTVKYKLIKYEEKRLFTHIVISLPENPKLR